MRVLLIYPPFSQPGFLPLGLGYLAAVAREAGHQAEIVDINGFTLFALAQLWSGSMDPGQLEGLETIAEPDSAGMQALAALLFGWREEPKDGLRTIAETIRTAAEVEVLASLPDADLVGVHASGSSLLGALLVSRLIRARSRAKVIWGGPFITPETGPALLRELACLDGLVHGDGELPLAALLDRLSRDAPLEDVPGLITRQGVNPAASPLSLDALPDPDFSSLPLDRYPFLVAPMQSSRGCVWNRCAFCNERAIWPRRRGRSPARVVDELARRTREIQPDLVYFTDAALNGDRQALDSMLDSMLEIGLRQPWTAMVRARGITRELLGKMRRTGCAQLFLGLEALDDDLLRSMNKGLSTLDNLRVIKLAVELGMRVTCNLIVSFPLERVEHLRETIALLRRLAPLFKHCDLSLSWFKVERGSMVWDRPEDFGGVVAAPAAVGRLIPQDLRDRLAFCSYDFQRTAEPADDADARAACHEALGEVIAGLQAPEIPDVCFTDEGEVTCVISRDGSGATLETQQLEGLARRIFLLADSVRPLERLARLCEAPREEVERTVAELVESGLLVQAGARVLNPFPRASSWCRSTCTGPA